METRGPTEWYDAHETNMFIIPISLADEPMPEYGEEIPDVVARALGQRQTESKHDMKKFFEEMSTQITGKIAIDTLNPDQITKIAKVYKVIRDRAFGELSETQKMTSATQLVALRTKALFKSVQAGTACSFITVRAIIGNSPALLRETDRQGNTALHLAAQNGKYEILNVLIEMGADRLAKNKDGDTPLHMACRSTTMTENNLRIINALCENVKVGDRTIKPALELNKKGQIPVFVLAQYRVEGEHTNQLSQNVVRIYDRLLSEESVKQVDADGKGLLHLALEKGNTPFIFFLLSKHPALSFNMKDKAGNNPLHLAVMNGQISALAECLSSYQGFLSIVELNRAGRDIFSLAEEYDKDPEHGVKIANVLKGIIDRRIIRDATKYLLKKFKKIEGMIKDKKPEREINAQLDKAILYIQKLNQALSMLEPEIAESYKPFLERLASDLSKYKSNFPSVLFPDKDLATLENLQLVKNIAYVNPMHRAAANEDIETFKLLLQQNPQLFFVREASDNPLHIALAGGDRVIAQEILKNYHRIGPSLINLLLVPNSKGQDAIALASSLPPSQIQQLIAVSKVFSEYETYLQETLLPSVARGETDTLQQAPAMLDRLNHLIQLFGEPMVSLVKDAFGSLSATLSKSSKTAEGIKEFLSQLQDAVEAFSRFTRTILPPSTPKTIFMELNSIVSSIQTMKVTKDNFADAQSSYQLIADKIKRVLLKVTAIQIKIPTSDIIPEHAEIIPTSIARLSDLSAKVTDFIAKLEKAKLSKENVPSDAALTEFEASVKLIEEAMQSIKEPLKQLGELINIQANLAGFAELGSVARGVADRGNLPVVDEEEQKRQAAVDDAVQMRLDRILQEFDKPYTIAAFRDTFKNALDINKPRFGAKFREELLTMSYVDQQNVLKLLLINCYITPSSSSIFDDFAINSTPEIFESADLRDSEFTSLAEKSDNFPLSAKTQLRRTRFGEWIELYPDTYNYWKEKFLREKNRELANASSALTAALTELHEDESCYKEVEKIRRASKVDSETAFGEYLVKHLILSSSEADSKKRSENLALERVVKALNTMVSLIPMESNIFNAIMQSMQSYWPKEE